VQIYSTSKRAQSTSDPGHPLDPESRIQQDGRNLKLGFCFEEK
jgi:hypothetical protein